MQHQVLAVPSLYEAFGIAYLEAWGLACRSLPPRAGAAHELITHGEHGFLVAPGDAPTLAQHLQTLQHDRHCLRRMSLAAYQTSRSSPHLG